MSRAPLMRSSPALGSSSYGAVRIPREDSDEAEVNLADPSNQSIRRDGTQDSRTSSDSCIGGPSNEPTIHRSKGRRSQSSGRRKSGGWYRRTRRPSSATSDVGMGPDSKYSFATGLAVPGNPVVQETPASSPYITSDEEDSLDLDGEDTKSTEEDPPDNSP